MKNVDNFRELGGSPTTDGRFLRKGLLYRSGALDKVGGEDVRLIQALGLKTIIDLRSPQEKEKQNGSIAIAGARRLAVPFEFDQTTKERLKPLMFKKNAEALIVEIIEGAYCEMVSQALPQLGTIFRSLLSADVYPVLIHCRAGKDRTGFVCAIIQLALGIEPDFVMQDYLKSNEFWLPKMRRALRLSQILSLGLLPTHNLQASFRAYPQYLQTVMDRINGDYGGIVQYMGHCGITPHELELIEGTVPHLGATEVDVSSCLESRLQPVGLRVTDPAKASTSSEKVGTCQKSRSLLDSGKF